MKLIPGYKYIKDTNRRYIIYLDGTIYSLYSRKSTKRLKKLVAKKGANGSVHYSLTIDTNTVKQISLNKLLMINFSNQGFILRNGLKPGVNKLTKEEKIISDKKTAKKTYLKNKEIVNPWYASRLLSMKVEDLTPELIELKRKQIWLTRQTKQQLKQTQLQV